MAIELRGLAGDYLHFKVKQQITHLFIDYIVHLEDLRNEDTISGEYFEFLRKKILDNGNRTIRELQEEIDKFDISE